MAASGGTTQDLVDQMKIRFRNGGGPSKKIAIETGMFLVAAVLVAGSAIAAKNHGGATPLVAIEATQPVVNEFAATNQVAVTLASEIQIDEPQVVEGVRWFNGKKVRPVRTVWITVTAYSPDHRSCGEFADGVTASNKSIWTNSMKLVAADTSILPLGTMLSIPGYDNDAVVPVLDRGGAIKGARLDVLFPSHAEALQWGVQKLPVTIWEYAD